MLDTALCMFKDFAHVMRILCALDTDFSYVVRFFRILDTAFAHIVRILRTYKYLVFTLLVLIEQYFPGGLILLCTMLFGSYIKCRLRRVILV